MLMTPYGRRLENDDTVQARVKMNYGPDGDDSKKKDEDAPELATLRLLSEC